MYYFRKFRPEILRLRGPKSVLLHRRQGHRRVGYLVSISFDICGMFVIAARGFSQRLGNLRGRETTNRVLVLVDAHAIATPGAHFRRRRGRRFAVLR